MDTGTARLKGLDGLRGVAATWVVLFHLWGAIQRRDSDWVPSAIQSFLEFGFLGVDIFFVLSGFVISYSVLNTQPSGFFIPRFILRRSIRIDPPYWATIALAILFIVSKNVLFPEHAEPLPTPAALAAHMFYLQDLMSYAPISSIFWTLCLEFQFYVGFATVVYLANRLKVSDHDILALALTGAAFLVLLASPYLRFSEVGFPIPGTIFPYLNEFVLGIAGCQYLKGRIQLSTLVAMALISLWLVSHLKSAVYGVVPALTLGIIVLSARKPVWTHWLSAKPLQFLGRISYSLYLTHAIVGWTSVSLLIRLANGYSSPLLTTFIFLAGLAISVIFAYVFYHVLEKYFIELSRKLKT
ncbi:MAG: acyltransferase [Marinobacter sp.]|uniref:acyltransferase family protein n=1 Tax=Marinobacter sp. TaxID=50741 RepID=UPI00299DF921|nr:acyltransferase [Marinobacter sp.]MDX1754872.1 acyltransferase [Marinobacter sp.]